MGTEAAVLPSRNEQGTISGVARAVDAALSPDALLVNVDASDDDATTRAFLGTQTRAKKIAVASDQRGKGYQFFLGLEKLPDETDFMLFVDTDTKEADQNPYKRLKARVVDRRVDYAIAAYPRHWHEGNLTNHLIRPVLHAHWGKDIPQPIAADYALSGVFVKNIRSSAYKATQNHSICGYGIDAWLVTRALQEGCEIESVEWKYPKRHAPSFPHLAEIYRGEAEVIIDAVRCSPPTENAEPFGHFRLTSSPPSQPIQVMLDQLRELLNACNESDIGVSWPEAVAQMLVSAGNSASPSSLADALWPSYLRRVIAYLAFGAERNTSEIESHLRRQARQIVDLYRSAL